ncbi:hypothetical protein HW555_008290, partial [Spodoptera exigua]
SKMEKLRFTFAVLAASDGKTNVICITSIETPDGCVYDVPDEQKNANKHTSITSLEVYAKIKNSLKKRHQTRKIWIPLTDQIRKIYLDAGENVQFNDLYLEEITEDIKTSNNNYKSESEHKNFVKIADKTLVTSTARLCNEIGKQEYTVTKKNFTKFTKTVPDNTSKFQKEIACKICEKLNKGIRYHPEEKCWFKQTNEYENRKKYFKNVNNTVLDIELNDNEQKNE